MLYLVGVGLGDEKDISVKGLEAVKQCEKIYLENYTSKLACSKEDLEKLYGNTVTLADREFVEGAEQLLKEAKETNVALLIIGDPLGATTHWDMLQRAKEQGIATQVIHNASIFNAVGSTGLQLYKFGKTTSIPFPAEGHTVETFYNVLKENQSIGAHTLFLLDIDPKAPRYLTVPGAIMSLIAVEKKRKEGLINDDTLCVGVARLGSKDQFIRAGTARQLHLTDFGEPVHALIIPGNLHFMEEEALEQWRE